MPRRPIDLDGTTLEGGGQLLRIAVGISALTAIPIRVSKIRGKRSGGGGLKTQHLTAVKWLESASSADVDGAQQKSQTLDFRPRHRHEYPEWAPWLRKRRLADGSQVLENEIDIGSPGSVGLVFQAVLPFILFSAPYPHPPESHDPSQAPTPSSSPTPSPPIRLTIKGGTNVSMSPSIEYISHVLLPTLRRIGLDVTAALHTRGWSTGRADVGSVTFTIRPLPRGACLPAFELSDRGKIVSIEAYMLAPRSCSEGAVRELLMGALGDLDPDGDAGSPPELEVHVEDSRHARRLYLLLVATTANGHKLGRDWLFDKKITDVSQAVEKLVKRVVAELAMEIAHGGCVDEYMRDQLVVFQALAKGVSRVDVGFNVDGGAMEASLHTVTAEWVVRELLGVEVAGGGECEGVGFVAGETFADRAKKAEDASLVTGIEQLDMGT